MFARLLENNLPERSFFLFGPRQVGKSTLLFKIPNILYLDLLSPREQVRYTGNPEHLSNILEPLQKEGTVIIDEVQKVPALLDVVHLLMEKNPRLRFILCGSSARKLRHGAANLLGGRASYRAMHPLTLLELKDKFKLDAVLSYGSLPPVYSLLIEGKTDSAADLLDGYVITYIREEIKAEALVRNLQGFQKFLDVAAASFSEQVNFLDISRQCHVAYATVREYYAVLEDTLLGFFLYPYLKSARKRLSHQPKFYFFDNGVTRALLGSITSAISPLERGRLFEQWCVQEITRLNAYLQKNWKLYFWRTNDGAEVDMLVEEKGRIKFAIEFKAREEIDKADIRGLKSFLRDHPDVPAFAIGFVERPYMIDGISVTSFEELLERINR